MAQTVADIIKVLDSIAPAELAEQWDNTGLQVGKRSWPVKRIRVALDPLPEVVAAACKEKVDLLITHHPLIFHPVKSLDIDTPLGGVIATAVQHRLSILCAHTNLDTAAEGLNDVLARKIGLKNLKVLGEPRDPEMVNLVLNIPASFKDRIAKTLTGIRPAAAGSGHPSVFYSPITAIDKPDAQGDPDNEEAPGGRKDGSIRLEALVLKKSVPNLVREIKKNCPEDLCTYHLYPRIPAESRQGLGRIGDLEKGMDLSRFAGLIKTKLDLKSIRVVGDPEMAVYKAAVCTGSGSSLLGTFFSTNTQVFITGDLRYHDAREAEAMNRGLIDIGHFPSEHIIKEVLVERMRKRLATVGEEIDVEACRLEKDPFMII
jgi:dinuclear metal center YbgI/SA1388 family protein